MKNAFILIGLSILKSMTRLPITWQFFIGKCIGRCMYIFATKLRLTTKVNIDLCFPELSSKEKQHLIKENFDYIGTGLIETAMAWWIDETRLSQCQITMKGAEHLEDEFKKNNGVILLGPHFTCLEMIGRLLGSRYPFAVLYRPHKNEIISKAQETFRKKYNIQQIPRHDIRQLIHVLKNKTAVWYAYDVDGGRKRSVFAPFFNIQTASLTAVSRLVRMTNATVVPISFYRNKDNWGYTVELLPALENFPSENNVEDATRLNHYLENAIKQNPEQYIWQYKRFKTRPPGEERFY